MQLSKILSACIVIIAANMNTPSVASDQNAKYHDVQQAVSRYFTSRGEIISLDKKGNPDACRTMMEAMKPVIGTVDRYEFELKQSDMTRKIVLCVNYEPSGLTSREYFPASVFNQFDD